MYQKAYQPLDDIFDDELSYIKIINVGRKFQVNRVKDHIQSKIVYFLMNINVNNNRTIYFTRHGESLFNRLGKIGGNAGLTQRGAEYAERLGEWVNDNLVKDENSGKPDDRYETEKSSKTETFENYRPESLNLRGLEGYFLRSYGSGISS